MLYLGIHNACCRLRFRGLVDLLHEGKAVGNTPLANKMIFPIRTKLINLHPELAHMFFVLAHFSSVFGRCNWERKPQKPVFFVLQAMWCRCWSCRELACRLYPSNSIPSCHRCPGREKFLAGHCTNGLYQLLPRRTSIAPRVNQVEIPPDMRFSFARITQW